MAKSPPIRVTAEGLREAQAALRKMGASAEELKRVNEQAAELVLDDALDRVPRRTGTLARSHRIVATQSSATITAGTGGLKYTRIIHFGWASRGLGRGGSAMDARLLAKRAGFTDKTAGKVARRRNRVRGGPIKPNPWLYGALDKRRDDVIKTYERQIDRIAQAVERTANR